MTRDIVIMSLITLFSGGLLYAGLLLALRKRGATADLMGAARRLLAAPLALGFLVLCLMFLLPALRVEDAFLSLLRQVVRLVLIAAGVWLLIRGLALGRERILKHHDMEAEDNLEARRIFTQIRVIERLLSVAVVVVGLAMVLMSFERLRQVGVSLMASAGVIGVIVGFAAQKSIATVLAGLQIALTQPIRMDDVVIVEGEWGRIEEITLTYVVVRIWDQRRLIVPITFFIDHPFQNWTRSNANILGTVFVFTDYTVPIQAVREKLHAILKSTALWDGEAWCLQVTHATERTVELRALMSARSSPQAWDLRCLVREALITYLQVTFPQHLPRTRVELEPPSGKREKS